jgi:hypothetical protein
LIDPKTPIFLSRSAFGRDSYWITLKLSAIEEHPVATFEGSEKAAKDAEQRLRRVLWRKIYGDLADLIDREGDRIVCTMELRKMLTYPDDRKEPTGT